jgi:hypothetical protein
LLLLAVSVAGCKKPNQVDEFPLEVGFQPLEPLLLTATFPDGTTGDPHPQGLGPIAQASTFQHWGSHARGYLHAPLAKVYEALQDPAASYIHNDAGGTTRAGDDTFGVEPFPVSFVVHYRNPTPIGDVRFDVTYRAGPLEGTEAAPLVIGQRYQKTFGTGFIDVMAGSLRAFPVDGAPEVTAVEMVAWLQAKTQDQADCDGTLTDLFGDLAAKLESMGYPP